jgi:hypothetical protein
MADRAGARHTCGRHGAGQPPLSVVCWRGFPLRGNAGNAGK